MTVTKLSDLANEQKAKQATETCVVVDEQQLQYQIDLTDGAEKKGAYIETSTDDDGVSIKESKKSNFNGLFVALGVIFLLMFGTVVTYYVTTIYMKANEPKHGFILFIKSNNNAANSNSNNHQNGAETAAAAAATVQNEEEETTKTPKKSGALDTNAVNVKGFCGIHKGGNLDMHNNKEYKMNQSNPWPWLATIGYTIEPQTAVEVSTNEPVDFVEACGGINLAGDFILTAAHCIER